MSEKKPVSEDVNYSDDYGLHSSVCCITVVMIQCYMLAPIYPSYDSESAHVSQVVDR